MQNNFVILKCSERIWVIFVISALLSATLCSCSGRPSGVISKDDMAELLADMHTGEAIVETSSRTFATDSSKQAFLQAIYEKHGVTREEVDSSLRWYGYNIERYMEVYDRTVEILEKRLEKAQDIAGASAEGSTEIDVNLQGDSVDVWPGMRWRRFARNMPGNQITFSLSNDRNWEKGDVYTLRSKIIDNHGPLDYTIAADYSDGTHEYISASLPGDGWHDIQFVLDSSRTAQRVYGIVSYHPQKNENVFIDSISLMRTRWGGHYRESRSGVKSFTGRTQTRSRNSEPADPVELPAAPAVALPADGLKKGERIPMPNQSVRSIKRPQELKSRTVTDRPANK